jgi:hypothetical protein
VRTLAWSALVLGIVALTGCGLGAGAAPSAVQVLVTRDFGERTLRSVPAPKVAGQETVMRLLMRNATVLTRYSGGFVQSIDGLSGGQERGRAVDWFYYVNGVQASRGAAETAVHPGDRIWWDRHDWTATESIPAVVGSFPEPFLNGLEGKRLPVRVECEQPSELACRTVVEQLSAARVPAAVAAPQSGTGPGTLRVLVGRWQRVSGDQVAALIDAGPRASGVYATFAAGGGTLTLLDADGAPVRTLGAGTGLVAATRSREGAPVWVVTGTDGTGVDLAAHAFTEASLDNRFAIAVSSEGVVPLPAGAG